MKDGVKREGNRACFKENLCSGDYLWKHLFLFKEFLVIKTTFSYFTGMFENPVAAMKTSCNPNLNLKNNQKYYEISTIYECAK